jgi:uncharacterized membrane-anchored protein YhcB (DUF1043 family)
MNLPWEAQLILAGVVGLLVGLLVMWLLLRQSGGQKKQHEALVQKFSDYRQDVDKHFVETAAAVDELNRSYQKVVQHLSQGAQNLMGQEALQEQLAKRSNKSVTVAYLAATSVMALPESTAAENTPAAARLPEDDEIPPPPYTDATEAEVVPFTGQPDRVADRVPTAAPAAVAATPPEEAIPPTAETVDLQQPKP